MQRAQIEETVACALAAEEPFLATGTGFDIEHYFTSDDYLRLARTALNALNGLRLAELFPDG